ncbi:MAG: hypothetical protein R2911_06755 [Caldilineaceae bacterium]
MGLDQLSTAGSIESQHGPIRSLDFSPDVVLMRSWLLTAPSSFGRWHNGPDFL